MDAEPSPPAPSVQPAICADEAPSAEENLTQLALQLQNPISSLIGVVTFENDVSFNIGPYARVANVLNVQPIFPVHVGKHWDVISRSALPLVWQPNPAAPAGETFGLSDSTESLYLTPAHHRAVTWGLGPVFYLPTATAHELGTGHWGIGPTAAFIVQPQPWSIGVVVSHIWSVVGPSDRQGVRVLAGQLAVSANLPRGWYINTSPLVATANWNAGPARDVWTIPVGGGVGKVSLLDGQPIDVLLAAYWNAIRPKDIPSPSWQLRVQLAWLFPR